MSGFKAVGGSIVRSYAKMATSFTADNIVIETIIAGVSNQLELISGRALELTARTEYFDVDENTNELLLGTFPVETDPVIDIRQDVLREWGSTTAVDTDYYQLNTTRGIVTLSLQYPICKRSIKVTYTGGPGGEDESFINNYPDTANALIQQVLYEYRNLKTLGKGSVIVKDSHVTTNGPVKLLPIFKSAAQMFGRGPMI